MPPTILNPRPSVPLSKMTVRISPDPEFSNAEAGFSGRYGGKTGIWGGSDTGRAGGMSDCGLIGGAGEFERTMGVLYPSFDWLDVELFLKT